MKEQSFKISRAKEKRAPQFQLRYIVRTADLEKKLFQKKEVQIGVIIYTQEPKQNMKQVHDIESTI